MPEDRNAEPACPKSTPPRRLAAPEVPISPGPLLYLVDSTTVRSSIHRILDFSRGKCKAMRLHSVVVLSGRP
jgi:hypothetical protein